ncbi:activator of HSP90 ATPase [Cnuibacter physcomitrellae]|uniref:Polyketide cyclase n=1 Tax=Cnuibacter physcomitrellae TaxID=1619308 RepID=A0A1X9LFS0_9MICO|nr:SRPBCC domain-containing protein [Cnuibacter physcomitrellae]ARJ04035.1 polyketide cyclase [Cnuibacter physcomitrellae]GGI40085.1 activator of HSP90 ATPase [Cnuibacter physcomitrellae]
MPVIATEKDAEALTLAIVAEFSADVARVWQLWADPRRLERWWGPPTWPATFHALDLRPGGRATYVMTGPDGTQAGGVWEIVTAEAPTSLSFEDRFADERGEPNPDMPTTHVTVTLEAIGGDVDRTRMVVTSRFESVEQMEQLIAMGMEEGLREAIGQIDGLLVH